MSYRYPETQVQKRLVLMSLKTHPNLMHKESGEEGNIVQHLIDTTAQIAMDQEELYFFGFLRTQSGVKDG